MIEILTDILFINIILFYFQHYLWFLSLSLIDLLLWSPLPTSKGRGCVYVPAFETVFWPPWATPIKVIAQVYRLKPSPSGRVVGSPCFLYFVSFSFIFLTIYFYYSTHNIQQVVAWESHCFTMSLTNSLKI